VVNFTTVTCRISSRLKWYKNYKNRLRLAKVIVKHKLPCFLWFTVYIWQIFEVLVINVFHSVAPSPSECPQWYSCLILWNISIWTFTMPVACHTGDVCYYLIRKPTVSNDNNNNPTYRVPECQKTSMALLSHIDFTCIDIASCPFVYLSFL